MISPNYLSFEGFCEMRDASPLVTVGAGGITIDGIRYNDRKLNRYRGQQVKCFTEEHPLGLRLVICFTMEGEYITSASAKRPYNDHISTFVRAMDFDPVALRKLSLIAPEGGMRGKPWHVNLAAVLMDVLTAPPQEMLTWKESGR